MNSISRRGFLVAAALPSLAFFARPICARADGLDSLLGQSDGLEYIRKKNETGILWATYVLDDLDEPVEISHTSTLNAWYLDMIEPRSATVSISVFVGKALMGYVFCTVVDGIIIAVTGQSGAAWVAYAFNKLINRPVPPNKGVYLSCDIYPTHSMEYIRCKNA